MSLLPAGTVVVVETKFFPPLTVSLTEQEGQPGFVIRALKPKVSVVVQGRPLYAVAPAGEPTPSEWPKVKIALAIVAALAVFSIFRIIK